MDPGKYNRIAFILAIILVFTGGFFVFWEKVLAATGINEQINFQGKLVNTDGTNIPNGTYNMEFKVYQDGDGVPGGGDETLKWTEDRLRNSSQGVVVTDGIFQVNLGSVTALSSVDWNQSVLWVSINVGNTNASCTPFSSCVPDGEMDPMVRFTAAPYALNADKVSGLTVTDTTGTLTIANSKTVSFADAFATSGAFATTLTVTNTTNATLPAGTVTLAALGTSQTWTANQTFANATANDDTLGFVITTGGAGRFAGTLTNADLTANHSWILPNADGTVALTTQTHTQNTDTGTNQTTFVVGNSSDAATVNTTLQFGNTNSETLYFDGASTDNFKLSDDLDITGGLTATLAITANGGISLPASQSLSGAALSYVDLGLVIHNTTAIQGLRLPQAASATPSSPTSGEGYLAWDVAGNQLITYNGAAWTTVGGGSQTPWAQDINAAGYDLSNLSNLGFQETTGAPASTDVGFYRDNTGDLTGNVLTGKTFNLAVNGADEYNFSSSVLGMNSNNITGLGTNLTAAGVLTIASAAASTLTVDSGTTGNLDIGAGANAKDISIGNGTSTTSVAVSCGSGACGFGNNAIAHTTIIGSATGVAITTIQGGTGGVNLGTGGIANTIQIGNTTGAVAQTINIGTNATGSSTNTVLIGSTIGTSTTTLQSGSGNINLQANNSSTGNVQIGDGGAASATPDMLVLDIGSAEPAGTNGAMYYDGSANKFRCYENGAWINCITATPDTVRFFDANPAAMADNNTTEIFDDATSPNITPDSASNTVLISVSVKVDGSSTADAIDVFRVVREDDVGSTSPSCDGTDPEVGAFASGFVSNASDYNYATGTFLDAPNSTAAVYYTVCSDADTNGIALTNTAGNRGVTVILVELGADLAENYYTSDDSIEPGDVVSIEGILPAGIKKSDRPYDAKTIGVISSAPGITLDDAIGLGQGRAVPVALAGRIPVKVSTENGRVKAGDYLTSSSVPGVAMKATKSGIVVGQALQNFSYADDKIGLVITFVKNTYFDGERMIDENNESLGGKALLQKMLADNMQLGSSLSMSEIATDKISAGLEIVTPKVTAETMALEKIEAATGLDININLADDGALKINNTTTGKTGITFDGLGNATFQGTLTAEAIVANKILGLEIFTNQLSGVDEDVSALTEKLDGLQAAAEKAVDLSTLGILEKKGGLVIAKETIFKEATVFEKMATLLGKVIFRNNVEFADNADFGKDISISGKLIENQDSAGYAVVKTGAKSVEIKFNREYSEAPIINATVSLQQIKNTEIRNASEELLLISDIKFIVTNATNKGFEIKIFDEAQSDIPFSWQVTAVNNPKTFESEKAKDDSGSVADVPEEEIVSADNLKASVPAETPNVLNNNQVTFQASQNNEIPAEVLAATEESSEVVNQDPGE